MNKQQAVTTVWHATKWLPPGVRWPNRVRRAVMPRVDPARVPFRNGPLTRDKTDADAEHIATVQTPLRTFQAKLHRAGYRRNVLSTLKYLARPAGRQWEVGSWVRHDGETQQHVYLFRVDGDLLIYGHRETSFLHDAAGHETDRQVPGDPDGHVAVVLE